MIREAAIEDLPRINAFLDQHIETSMFLRSNLATHGLGFSDHPHSTRAFLWEADGQFGVFGLSKVGYVMAQMPDIRLEAAQAFGHAITGHTVLGMTGEKAQVDMTLRGLGLGKAKLKMLDDEPLYQMELADLSKTRVNSRALLESDLGPLERWFARYLEDTGQESEADARSKAAARGRAAFDNGRAELLLIDGVPVAMADINAHVEDVVQLGGVFVPTEHRGKGYGALVTTAILQREAARGAKQAILFANNPIAARAYESIGFKQIGWYRIALLQTPSEVRS